MNEKHLTVIQLVKELQKYPEDAKVWTQGYDYLGNPNKCLIFPWKHIGKTPPK